MHNNVPDKEEEEDTLDDFMTGLGFSEDINVPLTPEQKFINEITEGEYNKIHNMRYHLVHEMSRYYFLIDENIIPMKSVANSKGVLYTKVEPKEYLRACLKYYLQMTHLPRFMSGVYKQEPCDMEKTLDALLEQPLILDALTRK